MQVKLPQNKSIIPRSFVVSLEGLKNNFLLYLLRFDYYCSFSLLVCGEFISSSDRNIKGVFKYDASTLKEPMKENESFICLYKFIAKKNEKVLIKFNKFNVKSVAPE